MDEEQKFTHPSYGLVGFSRGQVGGSGCYIFGSAVKTHNIITLTIRTAERHHHLNLDWFYARKELIEVRMTELQFAELITSLNCGMGIPCTIGYVNGADYVPGMVKGPDEPDPSEIRLVHEAFKDAAKDVTAKLKSSIQRVKDISNNSKMSKKDKEAIDGGMGQFAMEVESNLPFLLGQLTEAAGRVMGAVKTEVVAFTERTLRAAGLSQVAKEAPKMIDVDGNQTPTNP